MYYDNLIAEYLGTVLFLLSIFASGGNPIFIGATLGLIVFLSGKMNPGHVNPAVSVAMYFKKKISFHEMISFIIVQVLGGISSVYIYKALR